MSAIARVGQVRPSQLLYTFGPGALVDLPHLSVVISGTDRWSTDHYAAPEVVEERLLAAVQAHLGQQVSRLRLPPHLAETNSPFDDWARVGVPVSPFPEWMRCPACSTIGRISSGLFQLDHNPHRPHLTRYAHANCRKSRRPPAAVPVRFLLACRDGHLDEFPWTTFVHRGGDCGASKLEMFERDLSSRADDVIIVCRNCDARRSMVDAFGERSDRSLPRCRGRHPHLGTFDLECDQRSRALLLGASNTWFSVTKRVLAIPSDANPIVQLVEQAWPHLVQVGSIDVLKFALQNVPALSALSSFDPFEVWNAIEERRKGVPTEIEEEDLLLPEWEQFSDPDHAVTGPDFRLREVPVPEGFEGVLERVVLAERVREVVALIGFTRIDPPDEADAAGDAAEIVGIARTAPTWVPCTEVRGEGVFLQFRAEMIAKWSNKVTGSEHMTSLQSAHYRFRKRRNLDPAVGWPGARYLALHTVSHLLMRQFALECGYGSASIRERIYARTEPTAMSGILLYTAAPDSEGTLGGLVSLGEPERLGSLLRDALRQSALCTSDPMCAEHLPSPDEDVLHGAACHACLFAPETSCERANRYLDRSLITSTFAETELGLLPNG